MNMAVEWTIRLPYIFAYCSDCKSTFEIEKPTPTVHIRHCGNQRQRLPEKIYESFCDIRDGKQTHKAWVLAQPGEEPPTAGGALNKLPSAGDLKVRSL